MKKAALLDVGITKERNVIRKCEMILKRDKMIESLGDFDSDKPCSEQVIDIWEGFEGLTFNMARASEEGMKIMDFESLSAYGYLKYKKMLLSTVKKKDHGE